MGIRRELSRSIIIVGILAVADVVVAISAALFGLSPTAVAGNLLLAEVAALFILAGLVDFGTSVGVFQIRRLTFSPKEKFSLAKRVEVERKVIVFLIAGSILLAAMIFLAVVDLSTRGILVG